MRDKGEKSPKNTWFKYTIKYRFPAWVRLPCTHWLWCILLSLRWHLRRPGWIIISLRLDALIFSLSREEDFCSIYAYDKPGTESFLHFFLRYFARHQCFSDDVTLPEKGVKIYCFSVLLFFFLLGEFIKAELESLGGKVSCLSYWLVLFQLKIFFC